jgi:5-(carboxyamino)imidazole ribonucleotide mutase
MEQRARVGVVMGSDSDWPVMSAATEVLGQLGVPFEVEVVSVHRMPEETIAYGRSAADRGLRLITRAPAALPRCRACSRRSPRCR